MQRLCASCLRWAIVVFLGTFATGVAEAACTNKINPSDPTTPPDTVYLWKCWQKTLTSTQGFTNPYRDVRLRVRFTKTGQSDRLTYAYWDGGNTFTFRMLFPATGTWNWTSTCDPGSLCGSGLATSGTVTVSAPAPGETSALYLKGSLEVAATGRYLKHKALDGSGAEQPFYWLGDTAWAGPLRAANSPSAWSNYLTNRTSWGFSLIQVALPVDWMQVVAAGEQPRIGTQAPFNTSCTSGIAQTTNPVPRNDSCWNPAFWSAFEQRIFDANDRGFAVLLVGLMEGTIERNANGTWCPPALADSLTYARTVAARFAGSHVILSPAFDRWSGSNQCGATGATPVLDRIRQVGAAVTAAVPDALVTTHWASRTPGNEILSLQNDTWLDLQLFQSGQAAYVCGGADSAAVCQQQQLTTLSCRAQQLAQCVFDRTCGSRTCLEVPEPAPPAVSATKGGFNGESIYDGAVNSDPKLGAVNYTAYNARRTGWFSLLSGGTGYTYGSGGVTDWGRSGTAPSVGWSRRSGRHMSYLSNLFRGVTVPKVKWQLYIPRLVQILTPQPAQEEKRLVLGRATDGSSMIGYLPDNPAIKINLTNFPNLRVNGLWLNPRTGALTTAVAVPDPANPAFVSYNRPSAPPACPPVANPDPLIACSGEPTSDPCYCVDAGNPYRGERDWVLVVAP